MILIRYILFLILMHTGVVMATGNDIVTAKNLSEIQKYLEKIPSDSTIFFDVDDTIITPISKAFRNVSPGNLIDEIKQNKNAYANFDTILSNWRLERKVQLVDSNIPALILSLKSKYPVYALTKMEGGAFGNIKSMEEWRANELKSLGVEFSENSTISSRKTTPHGPIFYKGIFITGAGSKSQLLEFYMNSLQPKYIVLIDDREEQLLDIQQFCLNHKLPFLGIYFTAVKHFPEKADPKVVEFQKQYLLKHEHWLEDEEAAKLMEKQGL